jgi:GMC oxidoreductase
MTSVEAGQERHVQSAAAPSPFTPIADYGGFISNCHTGALVVDCRAHEVDNLYIVDTSVFPSIGAVNPALTAMANSLRVGDHLLERMK